MTQRRAGVVLHITSLPGPHGLGDLGTPAHRFVDWLASAGQTLWQVLPIHPVGPGHSPYQCPSAFAGSPCMVALQPLVDAGWLAPAALAAHQPFTAHPADFDRAMGWRWARLEQAAAAFVLQASAEQRQRFNAWCAAQADWLPQWTLYAAIKDALQGLPWWQWPRALARREPAALEAAAGRHASAMHAHAFVQWCFAEQWAALRRHAHTRGVVLMGDLPIFVAHDSADVWARPDLFWLDEHTHQPTVVAGVPPDDYTPDGQRWGNPLYRWDRMQAEGFGWWVQRVQRALQSADLLRIDHFRGFAGYWEVPASAPTARQGRWVAAPGQALFAALQTALTDRAKPAQLPIVAEDLGLITSDVVALRDGFGLPGMRIVYEGFMGCDAAHPFLPHHHVPHGLAYTSTHDSDTVRGWWDQATPAQRRFACTYTGARPEGGGEAFAYAVLRATYTSPARWALAPLQDLLGLGSEHRMNRPGTASGNWAWRFDWPMLAAELAPALAELAATAGR